MKQFLETIRIQDGVPQHLEWHQRRLDATMQYFFPGHRHSWILASCIDVPSNLHTGVTRCRIEYDAHLFSIHYFRYEARSIKTLQLMEAPAGYDYRYKYADRKIIEGLFNQRGNADDILIVKNGWITDTSIANIAFEKNQRWYTPSIPLLAGTTWKRLITTGILTTCPIHVSQLKTYDAIQVFNAMIDWKPEENKINLFPFRG